LVSPLLISSSFDPLYHWRAVLFRSTLFFVTTTTGVLIVDYDACVFATLIVYFYGVCVITVC
jgi:hypothetical protein